MSNHMTPLISTASTAALGLSCRMHPLKTWPSLISQAFATQPLVPACCGLRCCTHSCVRRGIPRAEYLRPSQPSGPRRRGQKPPHGHCEALPHYLLDVLRRLGVGRVPARPSCRVGAERSQHIPLQRRKEDLTVTPECLGRTAEHCLRCVASVPPNHPTARPQVETCFDWI